ncbi:MAG TPA: oligosaccharide flippase family protein, partial [Thermoguttaceae bacterium]
LNRELPYYIGKGDHRRSHELAGAAQAWAIAVGTVVGLALLGVAGWQLALGELWNAAGWATNAVMAFILFYNTFYLQMTYRTAHDFAKLAIVTVAENAISLVLVLLVALMNFYGMCLRALLTGAISTAILYYWRPVRVGPMWNVRHLKHLLIIGAPIFVVGQLYSWWSVLNSTLVFHYMGTEGMGLYSMVIMATTTLELLPLSLAQVLYPRMAEQFGRTGSIHDLVRIARKPIIILAVGQIPLLALACLFVKPVATVVVPAYVDAVPAIQWSMLLPFVSSFNSINHVFNVMRRQDLYIVALVLGMASYVGSLIWLIRDNVSLIAFPQAMIIGRVVYMLVCYVLVSYLRRKEQISTATEG